LCGAREVGFIEHFGDSKVSYEYSPIVGKKNVCRFDVAMYHASSVSNSEGAGYLSADMHDLDRVESTAFIEKVSKCATTHKFHNDCIATVEVDSVINSNNRRINQSCRSDCFDVESLANNRVIGKLRMKNFDCDSATKNQIVGFPDFGHATDSDLLTKFVALREDTTDERSARN